MQNSIWYGAAATMTSVAVLSIASMAIAAPMQTAAFDIPAGSLESGLRLLAAQSGERILYDTDVVRGLVAPAVQGRMTTDVAVARLLAGSGLAGERTASNVLIVRRVGSQASAEEISRVDDIVVTGSLIRGVADGPSPVVVVSRDEIDRQGHASVAQALAALPQNFGGTGNEEAVQAGADRSNSNNGFISGVNLRGLGSDATLVLINGRRMAGSGSKGDFADISTLPTSVVERIEILLDGASALYGSDAVGGVVNVILKREFEGAETRVRVGGVTDGPTSEYGFGQTVGRRWNSGGALLSYEYLDREALPASERGQTANSDLRPLGGSDRRSFYSNPGNLVRLDPATQTFVVTHAIPPNQQGIGLTPGSFLAGQTNLQNNRVGVNILPRQTRHSVFAAFDQALGEAVTLTGDFRYGRRRYETTAAGSTSLIVVDRRNPFFVSPTGAPSHQIAYSFIDDLGNPRVTGKTENLGASLGGEFRFGGDWSFETYVTFASATGENGIDNQLNTTSLREALGTLPDNPLTPFSATRDGFFNPFGSGPGSNPQAVLDFIGAGYSRNRAESRTRSINVQADGPVFNLPAGEVRLAVGAAFRQEQYVNQLANFTSGIAQTIGIERNADREVGAAFAELRAPLFGEDFRRPGLERLELSLAARFEDYDDLGQTTNPKVGVLWAPVSDVLVRASYGTSFRAPALRELNDPPTASPSILPQGASRIISLIQYGGNPDLEPEEAVSWTAGAEYRPSWSPDLSIGFSWFSTEFDKRIGQPAFENILVALSEPSLTSFVRFVNPTTNADDRAFVQELLDRPTTNLPTVFPAEAYGAVVDARYVNTTKTVVEGVDLTGRYAFDRGPDRFTTTATLSKLIRFETQATPTAGVIAELDRPNFPVALRGRASGQWSRGPWAASLSWNYVDAYGDDQVKIDAWLTTDAQLRFEPTGAGALSDVVVALNVQNLFDEDPPFYDAPQGIGYDAANADLLGRFVSLQVTKRW